MIYGKITLEDWRTACVEGEEPESSFESYNLRLFFYGTLYNRDTLEASPEDSNALRLFPFGRFVYHCLLFGG